MKHVVGLLLVRNEDIFLERVVRNIADFCDRVILLDHGSTDGTPAIARELARAFPQLEVHCIASPADSHGFVEGLAGTDTWVFGVDGDEIYDPEGLKRVRARLETGALDGWWLLQGGVLNCDALDPRAGVASGYLAPPCRPMTKLYNFSILRSWTGCRQRLHGGVPVFKEGYSAALRYQWLAEAPWEQLDFRCLHTCFLQRSHAEKCSKTGWDRFNVTESDRRTWPRRVVLGLRGLLARSGVAALSWKMEKYHRGPRVTKDVAMFFKGAGEA